jgi:hypothetical protein
MLRFDNIVSCYSTSLSSGDTLIKQNIILYRPVFVKKKIMDFIKKVLKKQKEDVYLPEK